MEPSHPDPSDAPPGGPGILLVDGDGRVVAIDGVAAALLGAGTVSLFGEEALEGFLHVGVPDDTNSREFALEHRVLNGTGDGPLRRAILVWPQPNPAGPVAFTSSGTFLEALLDTVTEGVVACDADGRLVLFNRASRDFHGLGEEPLPPERWAERYSLYRSDGRTPLPTDEIPLVRAFSGEEVREAEMVIATPGREPRLLLANGRTIRDATGARLGAVVSMNDITDRRRAEEARDAAALDRAARSVAEAGQRRAALLGRIAARLDASLGVERRLQELADEVVPGLADVCVVRLGVDGQAASVVARADRDRNLWERLEQVAALHPPSEDAPGSARVLASGESELIQDVTAEAAKAYNPDPAFGEAVRELGITSFLAVPLRARGRTIGVLSMLMAGSGRRFDPDDLALAEEIGRRAGVAIDNARLFEEESRARQSAERAGRRIAELQELAASLGAAAASAEVAVVACRALRLASDAIQVCVIEGKPTPRVLAGDPPEAFVRPGEREIAALLRQLATGSPSVSVGPAGRARSEPARMLLSLDGRTASRRAALLTFPGPPSLSRGSERQLRAMAELAAQALERAARYDLERELAETLQRNLLPSRLPAPEFARLAVRYAPALGGSSGGDFYDAVEDDARLAIVVGDVVGHGPSAAAVMGQLRSAWRAISMDQTQPNAVVERMSRLARGIDGAEVATVASGTLTPDGVFMFAAAGQPPPILRTAGGSVHVLWGGRGAPLGVIERAQPRERVHLARGDLVLLYTDGLIERPGRTFDAGIDAVVDVLRQAPADDLEALLGRVATLAEPGRDDCALLAVQMTR